MATIIKAKPGESDFDAAALKEKYIAERDIRIQNGGPSQYRLIEGTLATFNEDPYVEPGFTRESLNLNLDVVIIGGGYGAQLTAVRLHQQGITNFRLIEKGGDFGGTW